MSGQDQSQPETSPSDRTEGERTPTNRPQPLNLQPNRQDSGRQAPANTPAVQPDNQPKFVLNFGDQLGQLVENDKKRGPSDPVGRTAPNPTPAPSPSVGPGNQFIYVNPAQQSTKKDETSDAMDES